MSGPSNVQHLAQFMQHCPQAKKADAEEFLQRAEGDVELAVALFQSNQDESTSSSSQNRVKPVASAPPPK